MFTIGNWIFFIIWFILTIIASVCIYFGGFQEIKGAIINAVVSIIILLGVMVAISWYNTSTAAGARAMKDYTSNLNNGIEREITITAEDGREIFYYEGKIDIETDHEDNYILFDTQEGKRYIIYYGVQDTVLIKEK